MAWSYYDARISRKKPCWPQGRCPGIAMGEAAWRAAKMATRQSVQPAEINVGKLQRKLLQRGA